jgi:hypothetical protein
MLKYEVVHDHDPLNPRTEYDNIGTMALYHRRYNLGDKNKPDRDDLVEIIESKDVIAVKVYGYDHGGLSISAEKFSCPWDFGMLGYIYLSKQKAEKEAIPWEYDSVVKILVSEIETYNHYLQGNCWGYLVTQDEDDEVIDQCWGYVGKIEECGVLEAYDKNIHTLVMP